MQQDILRAWIQDSLDIVAIQYRLTVDDNIVTFNRNHLTGILIYEILHPSLQNTSGQLTSDKLLQVCFRYLNLFRKVEDFKNISIAFKTNSSQKSSYRQFLFTVDVSVHHIVDVRSELDPWPLERDNTCGVQLRSVCVRALSEEYARRTVQLRHDNTLGAVDHESTSVRHIRNRTQVYILDHRIEVLMIRVRTVQF